MQIHPQENHVLVGLAVGASGKNQYEFELIFCEAVNSEVSVCRVHVYMCVCLFFCFQQCRVRFFENEIEFRLLKKQCKLHNDSEGVCHSVPLAGSWPRLQSSNHRPHWLKTRL